MASSYRQPLSPAQMKALFGDPCQEANLQSFTVPILGHVTCHRLIGPQLQRILAAVENDGLAGQLDASQYGGIYCCRPMQGGGSYSHHSWGIAIDLNTCEQANGSKGSDLNFRQHGEFPHLRRLLPYFIAEGWAAGIQWQNVPDPMHFEARNANGTGLLASGTLKGLDLPHLDGLTDQDLAYLKTYPEFGWAFQPAPPAVCRLPNGQSVPYRLLDNRANVLLADVAAALGWDLDTQSAWPTIRCSEK